MTAGVKARQGYEIHVINFADMSHSDRYNPFDYVRKDLEATTVANTIVAAKNDPKKKDIWYNAQLSLLKALILYANYEFAPDQRNMTGVLDFLQEFDPEQNDEGESELDNQFLKLRKRHPARRAFELGYKKSQEKTRASIILSLLTTIGDFVDEEVEYFTSFSDFNLGEVGLKKIALYVIIPVMDTTWEGLINLFFNQMFKELYLIGSRHNAKLPQPVTFILDEFPNLGRFDDYETFLATCRGYGIGVATICQNLTQLNDKYGKEKAESILGNCAVKICLGNVNQTSAKFFVTEMGKATVKVDTESDSKQSGKDGLNHSESYSYTGRSLKTEDEIATMHKNESIVLITGKRPIFAKKAKQFEVFPNVTNMFPLSQADYTNKPNEEVMRAYQEKVKAYEDKLKGVREGDQEVTENTDVPDLEDTAKKREEDLIASATDFFKDLSEEEKETSK